jgi:alanine racemase
VAAGDVVVLLGRQGGEEITAWEWAARTDTIAYEVVCGVSARVPRVYRP